MSDAAPRTLADAASKFAREAGEILMGLFGEQVEVDYKNKAKTDPVSEADRASQALLTKRINEHFPAHGVLGEEKPKDEDEAKKQGAREVPDYLWVLDPLDGTKNFLNGLPVWGCSVGVLKRGRAVAGAIFTPEDKGSVYRACEGGGAFRNGRRIEAAREERPTGKRIAALPGSYWTQFRPTGELKKNLGEVRSTGSMCYEQALVARGGLHYALFGAPGIWDVAAGAVIVKEAGGTLLARRRHADQWRELDAFFPEENAPRNLDAAREWRQSLLIGNPGLVTYVAPRLRKVNRPRLWRGKGQR